MNDYISRKAAIDALQKYKIEHGYNYYYCACDIEKDLFDLSAEDIRKNVRGKWLYEELMPNDATGHVYGECSMCHKVRIVDNFCPNCGCKMYNGESEE